MRGQSARIKDSRRAFVLGAVGATMSAPPPLGLAQCSRWASEPSIFTASVRSSLTTTLARRVVCSGVT
jgi:hypothetical protein